MALTAQASPCSECGTRTKGFAVTNAADVNNVGGDYISGYHRCKACAREQAIKMNAWEREAGDASSPFHTVAF